MSLARQFVAVLTALVLSMSAVPPAGIAAQTASPQASPRPTAEVCAVPHRDLAFIVAALQPPPATSPEAHANHAVAAGVESHHATAPASDPDAGTDADTGNAAAGGTDQEHGDEPVHERDDEASQDDPRPQDHATDRQHDPATSVATPFEPVGTPRLLQPELPDGTPVADDSSIVAGLTESMHRYLACANAGDVIGLMSLVTPEFLRYSFGRSLLTEADLEAYAAAGRALPPEQRRRLVAIREPRQLADGRVVALVDSAPVGSTNPAAIDTDLITFVETDGRYYVDRYLAGVTYWLGPNATPTP